MRCSSIIYICSDAHILIDKAFHEAETSHLSHARLFECIYNFSRDFFTFNGKIYPFFIPNFHDIGT